MEKNQLLELVKQHFESFEGNTILEKDAIYPGAAGIQMFDQPLVGFGAADDTLFHTYQSEEVIGPWHMLPTEWLPGAKTVVSFFFPFSEAVRKSNRKSAEMPSPEWLHGRIEGQQYLNGFMRELRHLLSEQGIHNCVPAIDARFKALQYSSNWSERHAAYACGLGTFGLSKGLITEKGIAGRFASVIIDVEIPADERKYTGIYDYCTQCGVCVKRCPANAISLEDGKNHDVCNAWVNKIRELYAPRYGCGLCQTGVPCEYRIPRRN